MADFHKYKFYYAGNDKYEDGYDRIFGGKHELDKGSHKETGRVQKKSKSRSQKRQRIRKTGAKKRL